MLRLPSCGGVLERVLNNGWHTRVEHHHDGRVYLVIANQIRYEIVGCPPSRPLDPAKRRPPPNLYLLDKTGHRVRAIFQDAGGYVGSRHELAVGRKVWVYASYGLTSKQRQQRHIEKLKQAHPLRWQAMIDQQKDLRALMPCRPRRKVWQGGRSGMWRRKWIEDCVRAKWGYVRKGDAEKLQSEITAAVLEHLRKRLPWMKRLPGANFWRGLHPLNQLRKKAAQWEKVKSVEPPLPKHDGSW
jgi:hypothetical protein